MTAPDDRKRSIDLVEDAKDEKHVANDETIPLPMLLDGFSEDELKKIGRRATWKLDLIIMPAMTMFVSPPTTPSKAQSLTSIATTSSTTLIGKTSRQQDWLVSWKTLV